MTWPPNDPLSNVIATAYDRQVEYMLRDEPQWRALFPREPIVLTRRQRLRAWRRDRTYTARVRLASLIAGFDVEGWDDE